MDDTERPDDVSRLSFEEALAELETIVRSLEEGTIKLDDAIEAYERGSALKRHCEAKLDEAQARVEKILQGEDGKVTSVPLDLD
jgi:exodeoxyribonuclease VII small subunit